VSEKSTGVRVEYRVEVTARLAYAILAPYLSAKLLEQLRAVAPITLLLLVSQLAVFRALALPEPLAMAAGMSCVVLGLVFFIDGLRIGIMPLGENIGSSLPAKASLWAILATACVLGATANMAEPAIGALRILGARISPEKTPLLFDYLNVRTEMVLWVLSFGVGIGACHGIYRFVRGWSLKRTLLPVLGLVFLLTALAGADEHAAALLGVAWDAGGITTGTVTAPLLLALGVGMSTALGRDHGGMAGFGVIALCSIWPIAVFLGMGLIHSWTGDFMSAADGLAFQAQHAAGTTDAGSQAGVLATVGHNLVAAGTAILPLLAILLVVQYLLLREKVRSLEQVVAGIVFTLVGLLLFKVGLEWGLNPLGDMVGRSSVVSFTGVGLEALVPGLAADGRYGASWGRLVVMLFAFAVGYGATLAEPALAALGLTVEDVTAGAYGRRLVVHTVAFGAGLGLLIGVARLLFGWPALWVVIPSYALALLLTAVSSEKYVNIGWDAGGVTTGDITSPVLIALGLGVATAVGAADGFSLIAMGSVWPIIAVLAMGIVVGRTTPFLRAQHGASKRQRDGRAA